MNQRPINILELRCVYGSGGGPEKTIYLTANKINAQLFKTHIVYIRVEEDSHFNQMRQQYLETQKENINYKELFENHSFDWSVINWLVDYCFRNRIDIVHSHEYKTDVLTWFVRRQIPFQWVVTYHLDFADSFKMKCYQWLDYWVIKRADKIFTVSASLEEILKKKKIPKHLIENLPNGIDENYFDPEKASSALKEKFKIDSNKIVIGAVGRLAPQKNLLLLFEVVQSLIVQGKEVELLLVGDGPLKKQVAHFIEERELGKWVHQIGFVEDVRQVYKAIDILLLTSDEEGMPNSILEAMVMEVPVVATSVGGVPELIETGKEGLLAPKGDKQALTQNMIKLIEEPSLRKELGKRGREKVKKQFSFDQRVKRLEQVYEDIAERDL